MNTTRKGREASTKAGKLGRERGFQVYLCPHNLYQKDAFGIADQIWVSKALVVFVQVKCNKWGDLRKHIEFSEKYWQWVKVLKWVDRKGFVERDFKNGKEVVG